MQADQVPVIDLSPFATTTASAPTADQLKVASQLRDACETVGFFYIKGHGCSPSITQDMMKATNAFFDLPLDAKMELEANKNPLWRGYNSLEKGAHSCTPQDKKKPRDHKESFTIGAEPSMGVSPMHGPNQWPKLPDFETSARQYWNALTNPVATRLMQALALSLDLDMDFFVSKSQTSPHPQMVLLRYPPAAAPAQEDDDFATGCGAHTDCGFLTILTQDQPGLQVQHANGTWVDAPPIPDAFVVNLGDMMAHWTNDRYKSTLHRVRNPTAGIRHSIPFFWTVDYDTLIEPIPSCVTASEGAVYQPTTSGHYILGKLGLMYLAGKEDEQATTTSSNSSCKRSADDATMPLSTMEEKKPRKIAAQN